MIAEAGGTRNVIGSRIATPLTDPSPGIAPMNRPSVTPRMIRSRFNGWSASTNPDPRSARISIFLFASYPGSVDDGVEHVVERLGKAQTLGHRDPHQTLEEQEEEDRGRDREQEGQPEFVAPQEPHIVKQEQSHRAVERYDPCERDEPEQTAADLKQHPAPLSIE